MTLARDALDRQLIALLQMNARMPTAEIARRLGVARSTVHERIARLERERVIAGYTAVLARGLPGEAVRALVMLAIEQQKIRETRDELFNAKVKHATGQLEDTAKLGRLRRDVARLSTVLQEKREATK